MKITDELREAMASGFYCRNIGYEPRPRKERTPKPAPPHDYRECRIYTHDGLIVRCATANCQDDRHRVQAALS